VTEPRINVQSTSSLAPEEEIAAKSFELTRRGFDQEAVRRFLNEVALPSARGRARRGSLVAMLLEEAQHRADLSQLDEATLSAAVGQRPGRVLQVAHEARGEVLDKLRLGLPRFCWTPNRRRLIACGPQNGEVNTVLTRARRGGQRGASRRPKQTCMAMVEERPARLAGRILGDLAERASLVAQPTRTTPRLARMALAEVARFGSGFGRCGARTSHRSRRGSARGAADVGLLGSSRWASKTRFPSMSPWRWPSQRRFSAALVTSPLWAKAGKWKNLPSEPRGI